MKVKIISIFTVAALLVSSISAVTFASNDSSSKGKSYTAQSNKNNNKNWDKDEDEDDDRGNGKYQNHDKNDNHHETVSESVYKEDKKDHDKIDEMSIKEVTVALYTYGQTKSPEEVINLLLNDNVPLYKIVKAFQIISDDHGKKYIDLSDSVLKGYADAINKKIDEQKATLQERIDALKELTALYEKIGELEKALNIQKKAIKSDYKNILSYKKIGQVFNKKGDKDIKVFAVGEQVNFDVKPIIKSNRTLVPIRAIAETLEADVKWDEATKTVTLLKDGVEIKLVLGSDTAVINGKEVKLDAPAETLEDRTLVPVRFISEAFNSTVEWEPEYQIVIIY